VSAPVVTPAVKAAAVGAHAGPAATALPAQVAPPTPQPSASPRGPLAGRTARVAVLGASGYSGHEFVRLALGHPGISIAALVSREHAGRPAGELLTGVDGRAAGLPAAVAPDALPRLLAEGAFDTLVACLPHGAWRELAAAHPSLADTPVIVDLSSDHRDGSSGYRYGLPEAFRESLAGATRIANPGCYPTAATLSLLPALEPGWLAGPVTVTALSGVSGAGRAPGLRTSFVELDGGAAFYKVGEVHPHVPEMARNFGRISGAEVPVAFAPQLAPMARGILMTCIAPLVRPLAPADAHAAYAERFAGEPFVRVLEPGTWPETRLVKASNRCDLAVTTVHGGRTLLATAAIDNLVKGAAGQALQNLNLVLGWPEGWGLPVHGQPW
jgi:N-acetyl-gamma-glutamyl-phosphate reductase